MGSEKPLVLAESSSKAFRVFENSEYVLQWLDPEVLFSPKEIELPRYDLSFSVRRGKAESRQYPGYHLASKQALPALGSYSNFLLLENTIGQKIVLLPRQNFKSSSTKESSSKKESSLNTKGKGALDRQETRNQQVYLEYRVDPITQKLVPKDDQARYQLAMVHLWHMEYESAATYLRGNESSTHPLSKEEVDLLVSIRDLAKVSGDHSPEAYALATYAEYLLRRNANHFVDSAAKQALIVDEDDHLISDYLSVRHKTGICALSEEEEYFLLAHSADTSLSDPIARARYTDLVRRAEGSQSSRLTYNTIRPEPLKLYSTGADERTLGSDIPSEELSDLFEGVSNLFITNNPTTAWEAYGQADETATKQSVIDSTIDNTLKGKAFQTLTSHPHAVAKTAPEELRQNVIRQGQDMLPRLPDTLLRSTRSYGMEAEHETEAMKEVTKEQEAQSVQQRSVSKTFWRTDDVDYSSYQAPEIQSLSSALSHDESLSKFADVFDASIHVTPNLVRQKHTQRDAWGTDAYRLFGSFHKPPSDVFVVEAAPGHFEFLVGDQSEGTKWTRADTSFSDQKPGAQYTIALGFFAQGAVPIDRAQLEQSSQFQDVMTQIKSLSGSLDYSESELAYLRSWMQAKGPSRMHELFQKIIEWKDTTRKRFPHSALGGLFNDMGIQ